MMSARSGLEVRERRHVDQILVIEELVHLGSHEVTVETEELAEVRGVVHLDRLKRRAELLELPCGSDEEAPRVREVLRHQSRRNVAAGFARWAARLLRHPFRRDGSSGTWCARA
jgi:hypothetical protein